MKLAIGASLRVMYENWRGDTRERTVTVLDAPVFGVSEWHPETQWLILVRDNDTHELRMFAIKDMVPLGPG